MYTLIPMAFEATGAQGKGVKQFFEAIKKMRKDKGKDPAPHLIGYWKRRLSFALHDATSKGARTAMKRIAERNRLPGWRRLNEMEQFYAGDRLSY